MRAITTPLFASLLAQAMAAFTALTPPVFAVVAAPDLGIAARDVAAFTTLLFLAASFSAVIGGELVSEWGPIRATQICLLACAAGIALTATGSATLGALGGLVVGLGYGPMTPASSYMLARVTDDRSRPFVFSLKQTSVPIGGLMAGAAVPALVGLLGWRSAALVVASGSLTLAIGLQPLRRILDPAIRGRRSKFTIDLGEAVRSVRANPRLRTLGLVSFLYSAMQLCLGAYLVTFLVEDAAFTLPLAGFMLAVAQGAGIGGRLVWGALAGRLVSTRKLLAALGLVMAAAAVAVGQISSSWPLSVVAVVAALFGASAVGWNGLYLAEIVRVTSIAASARATGAALFFTFGGMTVGPALFAAIAAAAGFSVAFGVIGSIVLIAGIILLLPERSVDIPFRR